MAVVSLRLVWDGISLAEAAHARGRPNLQSMAVAGGSMRRCLSVLVVVGGVVTADVSQAATYYVSKTGSDSRSCSEAQSVSTPKATINGGVGCLSAGDTLVVRAGTYTESLGTGAVPSGNSWTSKVRIANYNGETVWMRPNAGASRVLEFAGSQQYIEFDGINLDGTNATYDTVKINAIASGNNAHHIRIQNAELLGITGTGDPGNGGMSFIVLCTQLAPGLLGGNEFINLVVHRGGGGTCGNCDFSHGFYINSADNLIERNTIYDVKGNGVQIYNGNAGNTANNNTVRYNVIRDLTSPTGRHRGVIVGSGTGNKVYSNLIYNIIGTAEPTAGIEVYASGNAEIYNNTIYGVNYHGIRVDAEAQNTVIRNNIAYRNSRGDYANSGSGTVTSQNLISVDPGFVNPGADFKLRPDSPARNAGATITLVQIDVIGTSRPQDGAYDIGAYELVGGGSSPPAPPTNIHIAQN